MNQDEVKNLLLAIEDAPLDFSVIFSGKRSKKVNGLYKCATREIIIHNRNFEQDEAGANLLVYTAIHEYAHHLHAGKRGGNLSTRAHTTEFWAIFHELLEKAEGKDLYQNTFENSPELSELTLTIRKKFLAENGTLVKELGANLLTAQELCQKHGLRFEDYIDRILRIPRIAAKLAIKAYQYNISPELGPDNMRFVAGIANNEQRAAAENALLAGKSPDTVKMRTRAAPDEEDTREKLEKEKQRLVRTIDSLTKRLTEVERELEDT